MLLNRVDIMAPLLDLLKVSDQRKTPNESWFFPLIIDPESQLTRVVETRDVDVAQPEKNYLKSVLPLNIFSLNFFFSALICRRAD